MAKCPAGFTQTRKTSSYGNYEVRKVIEGGETIYCERKKSSSPPPSELPDWVTSSCLNNFASTLVKKTNDIVYEKSSNNHIWGYWNDTTDYDGNPLPSGRFYFKYTYSDGDIARGTWGCNNNKVYLEMTGSTGTVRYWKEEENKWKELVSAPAPAPSPLTADCEPFVDKIEADKFRTWVRKNYPNIAKNIPGLPTLPETENDKELSRRGKCNSVHIQTAAKYKIQNRELIDLFKNNEVLEPEKTDTEKKEEVYNWWEKQKKEGRVSGGELVLFPPDSRYYKHYYAYKKKDQKDEKLFYFFLKDGTWFSYYRGKGYQEEGKWEPEIVGESKNVSLIRNLKKLIKEQLIISKDTKKHPSYQPEDSSNLSVKDDDQKNDQKNDQNLKSDTPKEMSQLQKDKESELVIAGYEKIPNCDAYDPDRLIEKINLKEKYPNLFDDDVCYVKYRELSQDSWNTFLTDSSEKGFSALTKNVQGYKGKENCRTVISNTYDAQKNNLLTNNKFILKKVKDFIDNDCHRLYKDKFERRTNNKLEWLVYNSAAFRQLNESTIKKNMKNTLNNNIKKHLKETIEVKKTNLVENRIIKSRLELTTSNSSNINLTVNRMITESVKMRVVGMDNNLIKENLMDLIDVLYKDKSTKVKKVFNQESAKYISDKIGLSEGAFLRRVINDVFSNNSIEKTIELFNNCDYLCNIISDEVSKTLGFSDNTVEDIFSKNMKPEFKSMICPIINSIGDKMENQFNKMKSKALDKS